VDHHAQPLDLFLAGLGQSFELIQNLNSNVSFALQWALALVTGAGVFILSYFASEYFSMMLKQSKGDEQAKLNEAWKTWIRSR
jgi:hypothetical protein